MDLLSFNYVRYLWARSRFQPFATVGIGTNRFRGAPGPVPSGSPVGTGQLPGGYTLSFENPRDNGWQFAWNYGGGADIVLQRHIAVRMELRNYVTDQPIPLTGTSHNLAPSAGLVFRFK
jgi:opacity protein-like surface antigen